MIEIIERATIETKEYNLDFANNPELKKRNKNQGIDTPEKSDQEIDKNVDDLGKYPIVYIDGVMIEFTNVITLELYNDGYLPSLKLEFSDPTNKLTDENFPLDNSIISIFKESTNKSLMAIKMDFKITDFTIIKGTSGEALTFLIEAIVNVDDFFLMNFESYKGTSYKILKDISLEMGLGFASNINSTDDDMVWINNANYRIEFMKDIVERSYIDDDTFLFGYIDYYYNFNFVDIEKQLKDDISEQMNLLDNPQESKAEKEEKETPLILSNNPDQDSSNMMINKYTIVNSSTNINLQYGYRHVATYYNKTDDEIKRYDLDSITDDDDNSIVLKGLPDENNGLFDNMKNGTYMGKQDFYNVHENYLHTILQNRLNLKFLQKLKMKVKMNKVNYGLYRFQKVLVELYNMGKTPENNTDGKKPADTPLEGAKQHDDMIINKLSGEWLITAINITYSKKNGNSQEITLVKRELTEEYKFPRRQK